MFHYIFIFICITSSVYLTKAHQYTSYSDLLTLSYYRKYDGLSDTSYTNNLINKNVTYQSLDELRKYGNSLNDIKSSLYDLHIPNNNISSVLNSLWLSDISAQCVVDTEFALIQLKKRQQWTYSMLDAYFKPPAGILLGNLQWLGSESECATIDVPRRNTTSFTAHQCYVTISQGNVSVSEFQLNALVLGLGLCVPRSCSRQDVDNVLKQVLKFSPTPLTLVNSICSTDTIPYSGYAIVFFIFSGLLLFTTFACTLYDNLVYSRRSKVYVEINDASYDEIGENENNESTPLVDNQIRSTKDSVLCDVLLAFSFTRNLGHILTVSSETRKEGDLSAIHGIRFISMTWVILGHTYVFGATVFANPLIILSEIKHFTFMAIFNATTSVDSFFLLSGILVSYHLLREIQKHDSLKRVNWIYFYVHRYVRLTIPYGIVLFFWLNVFKYTVTGPLIKNTFGALPLASNWWKSILYIQNMWAMQSDPMGWCWYLANDMQFFILSPIFVITLYKKKYLGLLLILITMVASWTITGVIASINKFPSNFLVPANDKTNQYMDEIYIKPYCRISPYLIGIMVGYALFATKLRCQISKSVNLIMWIISFFLCTTVIYANFNELNGAKVPTGVDALYITLSRSSWSFGVAWVVFSCANNSAGYINTLLSWNGFVPFSRTTFFTYLLHPIVLLAFYGSRRHLITFDETFIAYIFPGMVMLSYGVALLCTVLVESPVIMLEKVLLKKLKPIRK